MDIFEMLKEAGVEFAEDKKDAFNKEFRKTYKSEGEITKTTEKIELDRDAWKKRAETAEETLKKFDGVDVDTMQSEVVRWKQEAENAKTEYDQKIADYEFENMLKSAISEAKGKNDKAIRANLDIETLKKSRNQREDVKKAIDALKDGEETSFMFTNEHQEALEQNRVRFTQSFNQNTGGGNKKMTRDEILGIKDRSERQKAIAENISLFQ